MLGLVWTPEDIATLAAFKQKEDQGPRSIEDMANSPIEEEDKSAVLRYPMSLLIRPELLKSLQEHAVPSKGGLFGMSHVQSDALSLSDATKEDFLRKMGGLQDKFNDGLSKREADYYDPATHKQGGGFENGTPRSITGKRRK